MLFPTRELKPYVRPIAKNELRAGSVYYSVGYVEREMLTPNITTMVYVGTKDGLFSFQDIESFQDGLDHSSAGSDDRIRLYNYDSHSLASVYSFEEGLDSLLRCWSRRQDRLK